MYMYVDMCIYIYIYDTSACMHAAYVRQYVTQNI